MEGQRRRVLVVEDDDMLRGLLGDALTDEGLDVRLAAHGHDALATLGSWRPDLIVLDLMMPVMDGWSFRAAQQERADLRAIPVLLLSAKHDLGAHLKRLAPAAVVAKPFELEALLDEVTRLLQAE
jgi:CheY-like chemotaxis protein